MEPSVLFDQLRERIAGHPELVEEVAAVYQFNVDGPQGGSWIVDLRTAPGGVRAGAADDADCVISVGQDVLTGIMTGKVDPQMAFMMGKVKVSGNFMLATKLRSLLA